jgi:hypothetical protein
MKPRQESKPATPPKPAEKAPPRLRIVALEPRIAPKLAVNHNETLVRDEGPKPVAPPKPAGPKARPRLRIVPLEPRIAPKIATNHSETVVRDRTT